MLLIDLHSRAGYVKLRRHVNGTGRRANCRMIDCKRLLCANRFLSVYCSLQKQEKRRELRLKRFWRSPKTTSSDDSTGYESPTRTKPASDAQRFNHLHYTSLSQGSGTTSSSTAAGTGGSGVTGSGTGGTGAGGGGPASTNNKPSCSLPLLQVWPSQVGITSRANTHTRAYISVYESVSLSVSSVSVCVLKLCKTLVLFQLFAFLSHTQYYGA